MKELSIEQKAKAYDEAIEKLRSLHDDYDTISTLIDVKEELEEIFPELKESEDERIRQSIIKLIKMSNEVGGFALHKWEADEMLAWLEKQGESYTKRDVDDAFVEKVKEYLYKQLNEGNMECGDIETFIEDFKNYIKENKV